MEIFACRASRSDTLTPREIEVLQHLGYGKTTKEIAGMLKLSTTTVATHRKHICRKLGIHSTAELIAYASHFQIPSLGD